MPYYNTYIPQGNNFNNQFMGQNLQPQMQIQPQMQQVQPMQQMTMQRQESALQGRIVDSIDTVKGIEIPLNRFCFLFSISR